MVKLDQFTQPQLDNIKDIFTKLCANDPKMNYETAIIYYRSLGQVISNKKFKKFLKGT